MNPPAAKPEFVLNFGANLMKDGIERVVNGLPDENLGVLAPWRETQMEAEPAALSEDQ